MHQTTRGFTLIELIVVIAVIAILAGTMVPLVAATQKAVRVQSVEEELEDIAAAFEAYYFDNGTFPTSVSAAGFLGVYALAGVGNARLEDEWGAKTWYVVTTTSNPDTATVYSVGENGVDDGAASETYKAVIYGADAGNERTRQRMRIVAAVLANYLNGSGTLTGTWSTDRVALGLGSVYQKDGFGTDFQLSSATYVLTSAGADRSFGTADDLVF